MEQHPKPVRKAADSAFMESLNQLEQILQTDETKTTKPESSPPIPTPSKQQAPIDAADWEAAAADLEDFFGDEDSQ